MTIGQKIPDNPTKYSKEELKLQEELKRFDNSYIFVDTHFKRTSEPIFALAFCESSRHLNIDKTRLTFKDLDKILEYISCTVKKHYTENNGILKVWGEIKRYIFHFGNKTYIFDTDGTFLSENPENPEDKATLKLNRKDISSVLKVL